MEPNRILCSQVADGMIGPIEQWAVGSCEAESDFYGEQLSPTKVGSRPHSVQRLGPPPPKSDSESTGNG